MLLTEDPGLVQTVEHHGRRHDHHHEEVGEGEVDHQEVGRRPQRPRGGEDVDDDAVAHPRDEAEQADNESQDPVPQRVHGGELVPVNSGRRSTTNEETGFVSA